MITAEKASRDRVRAGEIVGAVASVLLAFGSSCTRKADANTRAAFEAATRFNERRDAKGSPRKPRARRSARQTPETSWQRVARQLDAAIALLNSDADAAALEDEARQWCAVTPEPKMTDTGQTYVCFPREPLTAHGRSFTLEFSPSGLVNLQIDELDESVSAQIVAAAYEATGALCAAPFAPTTVAGSHTGDFQACPVDGGTTLAIGRAPAATGAGWFVILAVLGRDRTLAAP